MKERRTDGVGLGLPNLASHVILAYGVRIGLGTNCPELLGEISDHLPPLWRASQGSRVDRTYYLKVGDGGRRTGSRPYHELLEEGQRVIRSRSLSAVLEDMGTRVKFFVAEMAHCRVFVHAGAVGWRGKAILIPGASMSGKTSLVVELVRLGATYYSDEYAVLDRRGWVHPYPQALGMRSSRSKRQREVLVEEIGGVTGTRPLPVGIVLFSSFKSGTRWRPEELSKGRAVLELMSNTVPARRKPDVVFSTLMKVASGATNLSGSRGEAGETASLIISKM